MNSCPFATTRGPPRRIRPRLRVGDLHHCCAVMHSRSSPNGPRTRETCDQFGGCCTSACGKSLWWRTDNANRPPCVNRNSNYEKEDKLRKKIYGKKLFKNLSSIAFTLVEPRGLCRNEFKVYQTFHIYPGGTWRQVVFRLAPVPMSVIRKLSVGCQQKSVG